MPAPQPPAGYDVIPSPMPGPPPGYTLDRRASMAPNQTNPLADTTTGQSIGNTVPQTSPPPGARRFVPPVKAAPQTPEVPNIEAPDIATDFGNQNPHPAQQTARGGGQWDADKIDPQRLQTLSRFNFGVGTKPLVEELRGVVWDAGRKHQREEFLWRDPGGNIRDDEGNKLDPKLVDRRAIGARAGSSILQRQEIHDPGGYFGHSTVVFNPITNEYSRPAGNDRPLPDEISKFGFAESEAAVAFKNAQAYSALEQKRAAAANEVTTKYQSAKEKFENQRTGKNALGQPMITEDEYKSQLARLQREYYGPGGIMDQTSARFNQAQKALEKDPFAGIRHPSVAKALGSDADAIINGTPGAPGASAASPTTTPPKGPKTGGVSTFQNWAK